MSRTKKVRQFFGTRNGENLRMLAYGDLTNAYIPVMRLYVASGDLTNFIKKGWRPVICLHKLNKFLLSIL